MELAAVLAFSAIAFTLVVVPGPDWAFVLAAGARDHVVAPAVGGLMTGYALITILVVVGVGPLVATLPVALTGLTVAGAGYLVHLGVRTLRGSGRIDPVDAYAAAASSPGRHFVRGVGVSALNPKGLLIFLSILPQFTRTAGGWPAPAQLATLGGIFVLIVALFYLPLGHAADRVLGARPRIARITTGVAGAAMVLMGAALLIERIVETIS
ncbi:LysE family translocator [Micromonospora sp. WMMD1128]|uniref:LysE family translocator n=1 Tax=unclassified Micromonospora TaxID=2617518 RepID=UPI00248A918D|nr:MULTISPECIES: LysE family translocator [unclassified Micromonospora]WBB75171.1 LysE family translocator [Micromonospora sp. WMMD1128]WFE31438.1 LysE family translocator [Micromonospora sp. WMMD975]